MNPAANGPQQKERPSRAVMARQLKRLTQPMALRVYGVSARASLSWFFWVPGNNANHLVLSIFVLAGVMNALVARMSWFQSYLLGTSASFFLLWARCATGDSECAGFMAAILPVIYIVIKTSVRSSSKPISGTIAAQIENEWLKEENARARDEAERANRMKSNFLANMSHELRTPLNAVLGFSEIIASQPFGSDATEKYRDYASDIHTSGRHLLGMINGLLDIAKIEDVKLELQPVWVDGERELREVVGFVAERAAVKDVRLEVHADPDACRIWCNERAFLQAALNLLSNAVKCTQRGTVLAELTRRPDCFELKVRDTGCGIPAHQISRVFEAFEQVDNRYTKSNMGTGLGLTLVRALVTLQAARVAFRARKA